MDAHVDATETLHKLFPAGGLTPERDAAVTGIVTGALADAYLAGKQSQRRAVGVPTPYLAAALVLLMLSLAASGYLAATRQPVRTVTVAAPTAAPFFQAGAPQLYDQLTELGDSGASFADDAHLGEFYVAVGDLIPEHGGVEYYIQYDDRVMVEIGMGDGPINPITGHYYSLSRLVVLGHWEFGASKWVMDSYECQPLPGSSADVCK